MRIALDALFSSDIILTSINTFFNSLDLDVNLISGESDGLKIVPLHHLPLNLEEDVSIFALIGLGERRNFLLMRKDLVDPQDRIGLRNSALVNVSENFVPRKLKSIRSDIDFNVQDEKHMLSSLSSGKAEHVIVPGCFMSDKLTNSYKVLPLDAREFGHEAGQGYLAVLGGKDHPLRKLIRKQNTKEDIAICNIERKMLSLSGVKLNNHCEIDDAGNFHLWAFTNQGETHISQSTRNEIEERALKNL